MALRRHRGCMNRIFVPYSGEDPAAIEINGHRLLIVASNEDDLDQNEELLGSDEIKEFDLPEADEPATFAQLAQQVHGGIVMTPPGIDLETLIEHLARELPWLQ